MKYKKLLEGLKIREVSFEHLLMSDIIRMESEFYNSDRLVYPEIVTGEQAIVFSQYGTSEELNEINQGYPVLRLNEYDSSFIGIPSKYCHLLDEGTYKELSLKENDVLICRTNGNPKYVGKAALVPKDYPFAFASYLFRVRPNLKYINSATLVAYLNSKYGRIEIERYSMQSNQANFSPAKFREIAIPVLPSSLCEEIEKITYSAFGKFEEAKELFYNAQQQFETIINIPIFPVKSNHRTMTLKDSLITCKRVDAEYYQYKYQDIEDALRGNKSGSWSLDDSMICDSNFTPANNVEYKYIELSNVGDDGIIWDCMIGIGNELPTRARRKINKDDVLVSYLEGSLSSCALVNQAYDDSICSNGFYVLRNTPLKPEVLLVLMKSEVIQQLLHKGCSGHIMPSINKEELKKIPLPHIPSDKQEEIATLIRDSFTLREQSQRLLCEARRMIEKEIENPSK